MACFHLLSYLKACQIFIKQREEKMKQDTVFAGQVFD